MRMFHLTEEQLKEIEGRHESRVTHILEDDSQNVQKASKYRNKRFRDETGVWWDSIKEHRRYQELRLLETSGKIQDLQRQVKFDLLPAAIKDHKRLRPLRYVADFVYLEDGARIVEDAKGFRPKLYKLKKRLMWQLLGIDILET